MYKLYSNIICSIAFSYFCSDIVHGSSQEMVVFSGVTNFDQMIERKNAAKVLDISVNATQDEIKKAYLKLASQYHPDNNNGKYKQFQKINAAYACMTNTNSDDELQLIKSEIQKVYDQYFIELCKGGQTGQIDQFSLHVKYDKIIKSLSNQGDAKDLLIFLNKNLLFLQSKNRTKESCNKKFGMHKYPAIKKEVENIFKQKEYEELRDVEKTMHELENQANTISYERKVRLLVQRFKELSWHEKFAIFGKKEIQPDPCKGPLFVMQLNKVYHQSPLNSQVILKPAHHEKLDKKIQDIDNQLCNACLGSIATVGAVSSLGLVVTGIMLRYKNS